MRNKAIIVLLITLFSAAARADFFDDLVDAVEETAKNAAMLAITQKTEEMIRDMIIGYESEQTRSEEDVSQEYKNKNGTLPRFAQISQYRTSMYPDGSIRAGSKVTIKSVITIVPGTDGRATSIEERLTIYDNEDTSLVLKSLSKPASNSSIDGGEFRGEFTFTLPEGMPQGDYPVRTTLLLNGELVDDKMYSLQLVMQQPKPARQQWAAATINNY